MTISKIRSVCAFLIGMSYRELPGDGGHLRQAIDDTLIDLGAKMYRESGSPAGEVENKYFRIGKRKLRICTEDEMLVSLWGSKVLVDEVHSKIVEKLKARGCAGV
jgi:hypothetical protein